MVKYLVKVKTRQKAPGVKVLPDGSLQVAVTAIPERGRANQAVIDLLAKHFAVNKSKVRIVLGHKIKNKLIEID